MGRQQLNRDLIECHRNLGEAGILSRCEEILEAIYGITAVAKPAFQPGLKATPEMHRVMRRVGLQGLGLSNLSPALISNLSKHAQRCCTATKPSCAKCPLVSFCAIGIRRTLPRKRLPIAIDLCAGAGSLSAGFRREGFHLALAVEIDRHAAQSYRVNNPGVPVIESDIRKIHPSRILRLLNLRDRRITAVISGPPCQGFSAAGPRKPRARRNFLFRAISRIAKGLRASLLVMENVPGLQRVSGVSFDNKIRKFFERCGYVGAPIEVDASQFGVPQRRKRLIFVCSLRTRDISCFKLRSLRSASKPSVTRALRRLPTPCLAQTHKLQLHRYKGVYNHRAMAHSSRVIAKISSIKSGSGPISYRRLRSDLANTLIAGHRAMPVHPRQHRTITVREAARLQTMPDSFRFLGPHSEQPLQVANVVPYRLSRAIARSLLSAMEGNPSFKER
jgi:DNA (cytosine-5)-methyltransferase 1